MRLFVFFVMMIFFSTEAMAQVRVKVVDGDSLEIDDARIRLQGIDSPEYGQFCHKANNAPYDCGSEATKYMQKLVDMGKVVCIEEDIDRYGRHLSICYVDDYENNLRLNINIEMLKAGWAVVYRSNDYEMFEAEQFAKDQKLGIWQGKFMKPELYRALKR